MYKLYDSEVLLYIPINDFLQSKNLISTLKPKHPNESLNRAACPRWTQNQPLDKAKAYNFQLLPPLQWPKWPEIGLQFIPAKFP